VTSPVTLSIDEVCQRLDCRRTKVKDLLRAGDLTRAARVGARTRVTIASVEAFEARITVVLLQVRGGVAIEQGELGERGGFGVDPQPQPMPHPGHLALEQPDGASVAIRRGASACPPARPVHAAGLAPLGECVRSASCVTHRVMTRCADLYRRWWSRQESNL